MPENSTTKWSADRKNQTLLRLQNHALADHFYLTHLAEAVILACYASSTVINSMRGSQAKKENNSFEILQDFQIQKSKQMRKLKATKVRNFTQETENLLLKEKQATSKHTDTTDSQEDDYEIPSLEDFLKMQTDGIFTTFKLDDEGAVADFTNLETIVNVSPIPTSRINPSHPSTLILGDPTSAVQTRSKLNKSSEAHAFVSYVQKQRRTNHKDFHHYESWVDAMQEELLQFEIQKVWILVDLPYGKKAIVYQKDVRVPFSMAKIDEEDMLPRACQNRNQMYFHKARINVCLMNTEEVDFANVKTASTPIETHKPLVKDEEASDVDVHLYRSYDWLLNVCDLHSMPDIKFAVCACSRVKSLKDLSRLTACQKENF
ncbi:hypothetical protein Tco_0940892 [Tanacetum coccineum]|uniref:Uncharacterized protein n=1 Tax=Tanacetum coccineum TaxID=301880 RepID=A0ABQ5DRJ9_9ASTR